MSRKKQVPIEKQVNRVIDFFSTHKWAGLIAGPLNIHNELHGIAERYLFDCHIDLRNANEKYNAGNIEEAKKCLRYAVTWKDEAYADVCYTGGNTPFISALFKKTDNLLDDAIETVFAGECPPRNDDSAEFYNFKLKLAV